MYQLIYDFFGINGIPVDPNLIFIFVGSAFLIVLMTIYDMIVIFFRYLFGGRK